VCIIISLLFKQKQRTHDLKAAQERQVAFETPRTPLFNHTNNRSEKSVDDVCSAISPFLGGAQMKKSHLKRHKLIFCWMFSLVG